MQRSDSETYSLPDQSCTAPRILLPSSGRPFDSVTERRALRSIPRAENEIFIGRIVGGFSRSIETPINAASQSTTGTDVDRAEEERKEEQRKRGRGRRRGGRGRDHVTRRDGGK
jgi:hypothetical protein